MATPPACILAAGGRFLALIVLIAACFGLPLDGWLSFAFLSFASVAALVGTIGTDRRRWTAAVAVALACIVLRNVLPAHQIEEGHAVFSPVADGPLAAALPGEVFSAMQRRYRALQPNFAPRPPERAWAFSADGIWQRSPLSRSRRGIDFDGRSLLRIGTINDIAYNDLHDGSFLHLPLVFRFDLPETAKGGRLCWRGTLYWPRSGAAYEEAFAADTQCRTVPTEFAGQGDGRPRFTVYAADFDRDRPLAVRLDDTGLSGHAPLVLASTAAAAAATLLALLVRVRLAAVAAWAISILSIVAFMARRSMQGMPWELGGLPYMERGNDGLFHFGVGRLMLARMIDGAWIDALRGAEEVFYFMPGMRYAWTGLMAPFGDSFFGYFLVVTTIPFIVLFLLRACLARPWALFLFWAFLLFPTAEALGFMQWHYVKLAVRGFGEGLGWWALLAGVLIWLRRFGDPPVFGDGGLFLAGLLFSVAIACRPNLAVGVLVLVLAGAALALGEARRPLSAQLRAVALLGLGSSAILLLPLHNWHYGGAFVPLTRSWNIDANLLFGPAAYADAFGAVFRGDPAWAAKLGAIASHLKKWMPHFAIWFLLPYVSLWVAVWRRDQAPVIRILAASLLADHAVFLFYPGYPRYTYGIWLLTLLVFAVVVRDVYWPAIARRLPAAARLRVPPRLRRIGWLDPAMGAS